jgi:hypothetical protein
MSDQFINTNSNNKIGYFHRLKLKSLKYEIFIFSIKYWRKLDRFQTNRQEVESPKRFEQFLRKLLMVGLTLL